jgi:hypothetical protein
MNINLPGEIAFVVAVSFFVVTAVVHIGFATAISATAISATAISADAGRLQRDEGGPLIVGQFLWTLATLLGGVFVAGLYWVVHHSALSRR